MNKDTFLTHLQLKKARYLISKEIYNEGEIMEINNDERSFLVDKVAMKLMPKEDAINNIDEIMEDINELMKEYDKDEIELQEDGVMTIYKERNISQAEVKARIVKRLADNPEISMEVMFNKIVEKGLDDLEGLEYEEGEFEGRFFSSEKIKDFFNLELIKVGKHTPRPVLNKKDLRNVLRP